MKLPLNFARATRIAPMLFFLLFIRTTAFAQPPLSTVTPNACDRSFVIKFPIWWQNSGGNDDETEDIRLNVTVDGVKSQIFRSRFTTYSFWFPAISVCGGEFGGAFQPWDCGEYFTQEVEPGWTAAPILASSSLGLTALAPGGDSWVMYELTFSTVPASWYGKTISVQVVGSYDGDDVSIDQNTSMSFPSIPAPTNLQATSTCTSINVTWTKPNLPCSNSQHKYQIRYRKLPEPSFGAWVNVPGDGGTTNFLHAGLNPGDAYEYEMRTVFSNNVYSIASDKKSHQTTPLPGVPGSFTATSTNCDQTITLNWGFMPGVTNFVIYRDDVAIDTVNSNTTSFTDQVPEKGQPYSYTVKAMNVCGLGPTAAGPVTGIAAPDPGKPGDVSATIVPGVGVTISWPDVANETGYRIERSLLGGGGSSFFNVGMNTTTYTDMSLLQCQTYEYRVSAYNNCKPAGVASDSMARIRLVPDLSNTFNPATSLNASKGYFSNRVEISWSLQNPSNFINAYKIYRKPLGAPEDSTIIETLNAGSNFFIDNYADAGVLYQYFIVAESQCENTVIYSNVASSIGFRSPFGVVTGKVTYGSGVAVQGVRIAAESTSGIYGKSIVLTGSGSLKVDDAANLDLTDGLLLEAWVKPAAYAADFALFEKAGSYSLKYEQASNQYVFRVFKNSSDFEELNLPATEVPADNFSHIAAQVLNDSLQLFVNGLKKASLTVSPGGLTLWNNAADLIIGAGYNGIIDEVRCWNIGKPAHSMQRDYSRMLNGGEAGLMVYLRMNEGTGANAYDFSKSGAVYNRNHAAFQSTVSWSNVIPTPAQLGAAAYTDALGNYVLNTPYHGNGEVFVLTPSYLVHEFDPATAALYIGDGSSVHVGINFLDKSSFTVSGSVLYQNTTCGVKDAILKVDGQIVIEDGLPVKTDENGQFEIQVPIGLHTIELEQAGHTYSVGRFPATGKYDFQEDLAGILFVDSTRVKVVGRVVGGLREAQKIPGLGKSKNNIGVAQLTLTSQQGNGCSTAMALTDANTGEYTLYVPPLKYIPTVSVPGNPAINFGVLQVVDVSGTPALQTEYDTTFNSNGGVVAVDSIQYHKQLDYIYRVNPEIAVFDRDGVSPFIGDQEFVYILAPGDTIRRNLRTDPFLWPVLRQQEDDFEYRCLIKVFEQYVNLDQPLSPVRDSVPTTDGTLMFNNELSHLPEVEIDLKEVNDLDSLKTLIYSFKPGYPNFLSNSNIEAYSYTRRFEINLITSSGQAIPWLPVTNPPLGGDPIFRAYLLGKQANGDQFVTFGPQIPEYVLRDPPGSGSSASREIGSTKTEVTNWSWTLGGTASTSDNFYAGAKFSIGLGVSTATDVENNNTVGFTASISGGNSGSQSVTTTNTKAWSTFDDVDIAPGASSDVYIGKSKNLQFGVAQELSIIPNGLLNQIEPLGDPDDAGNGFSFGKKYGLSVIPGGYQTQFLFNETDIINLVIPNLVNLRNAMLQSNPKYTSKLPVSDPNYGKNNDDPAFGANASTDTPNTGEFEDLDGPSYLYNAVNLEDTLTGDSVRTINIQIAKWEEAIRLNEWEKVNIDRPGVIDSLKQLELDRLDAEYKEVTDAYYSLIAVNGLGGVVAAYGLIATPVPGTAVAGYATFAVTTSSSIVLNELAEEYETYLAKKARINEKFDQVGAPVNYTFTGGTSFSESITHGSAVSYTRAVEYGMTASMAFAVSGKVSNNGVGIEKSLEVNYSSSRDWGRETSVEETVAYTLADNAGDLMSVDVYPSMLGWGPIFKTKAGSATSCPYEPEVVTSYYQPGTVISGPTLRIEKPTLTASPSILTNIPSDEAAVFNLTLGNASEVGYTLSYELKTISASNPFGAIVRFDGVYSQSVEIPGGSSVNKVMTIAKGPGSVYDYENILIVLASECQGDLADSIYVSAHFLPTCTDVSVAYPEDKWVLNNSFNDTMPVAIVDYNVNLADLEYLRVDYKPSDQPNWTGLQTFLKDTTGLNDPSAQPIPSGTPFTLYDWDVAQLPDGAYDLRVVSECTFAEKTSATHSGVIDRINPHPFGTPAPADGILSPNDEISIQFNEGIYAGSINPAVNFDIRGVTNGTPVKHETCLSFDGINDQATVPGGVALQRRDFTIEFAAKRNGTGEAALVTQGTDANERLFIGFDDAGHFVFRINDQEVASAGTFTDDDWHYFAVSYDYEGETALLYVADGNNSPYLANPGNTTIYPDYVGEGPLTIGRNSVHGGDYFAGSFHELRIWNTNRTLAEFSLYKSALLSGNEPALLYNWRFDEGAGAFAEEHIRRRDATLDGATWQITPSGSSALFDGGDDHLNVATGDVNITEGMDFTLEFWFNSLQSGAATLYSNGTGTGLAADSLLSWNIDKDEAGLIHVKHAGMDFTATNENFFDGQWHHFALVLQRNGNLTAYVDGNLQAATQAQPFRQLGGSHMYLGARGYYTGIVENVTRHFAGALDEFRIWNTSRKLFQIRRDKNFRMSGNEPGLKLYLPFESYATDPTGIPILTPTFEEQVNSLQHSVANNGGVTLSNQTPAVKIQRPVQQIAFTYSVNNDKVILTPTTSQEIIENVTLDITVTGLKDLHGNVMESPVTWIAYVDKNQVIWQDDQLDFSLLQGNPLSFMSSIVNQGGSAKVFSIIDVPAWLTVAPQSGTINPNSALTISFEVNPNVAIGDYTGDIGLLTDFNFPERLTINLKVRKPEPNWTVNAGGFEHSMGIIGRLKINNVISTDEEDMLVAMVGTQVRGVCHLQYVPQIDAYLAFLDVYSNAVSGEVVEFRIWDASSGTIYSSVTPNDLMFESNASYGTALNPQVFTTGGEVSFDVPLNAGWNWLGFPLLPEDPKNITKLLESFGHSNGDQIKGFAEYANYNGNSGQYVGTLLNAGVKPEQLYKLSTAKPGTLTMKGTIINPATRPIALANGWNWIGFISVRNQTVTQALGNLTPQSGDIIKGKSQFATYEPGIGWIGSLQTLKPGQGFMYKSNGVNSFTYPQAGMFGNLTDQPVADDRGPGEYDAYSTNMTVLGAISTRCGELLEPGKVAIDIVDGQRVTRGYAPVEQVGDQLICFLTIAGADQDNLHLRLIDSSGKPGVELNQRITYESNQHFGSLDNPYQIQISDEVCAKLRGEEVVEATGLTAAPSLFRDYFYLDYQAHQADEKAWVQVTNMWGQIVFTTDASLVKGSNRLHIDLAGRTLPDGLYTAELFTNGRLERVNVIKVN